MFYTILRKNPLMDENSHNRKDSYIRATDRVWWGYTGDVYTVTCSERAVAEAEVEVSLLQATLPSVMSTTRKALL